MVLPRNSTIKTLAILPPRCATSSSPSKYSRSIPTTLSPPMSLTSLSHSANAVAEISMGK